MGSRPLRIGMIGAGWVTAHHLEAWRELAGRASVVAICDPDAAAVAARAEAFGIAGRFASAVAMLDGAELDALDVCSPRETHAAMVGLGAARGLAVMCQKPLAPTLAAAEALVAAVGGAVPLMVHENWRFRPYYRRLRAWLEKGRLGDGAAGAARVPVERDDPRRRRKRGRRWCGSPFFAGLERMLVMEILIHHLDTLRFLLGELAVDAARLERTSEADARRGRCGDRAAPGGGRGAGVRDRQPGGAGGAAAAERRAHASSAATARRPSMGRF